jgi:alpha-L-rhamnosidase
MKKRLGLLWLLLALPGAGAVCDWSGTEWISDGKSLPARDEDFYADDPAPQFRKTFSIPRAVKSAQLHIVGLGFYAARVNGQPLGDCTLAPLWTPYGKRVLFDTHDVTGSLRQGGNVLTVTLGNGWFNPLPLRMWGRINPRASLTVGHPCLRAKLEIVFADSTSSTVASDASWKVAEGPLLRNSLYLGEVYDARKETAGWLQPDFNDSAWHTAARATGPAGELQPRGAAPRIGLREMWPAVKVTEPQPRVFVVDLGRNFAGQALVKLGAGPAGQAVTFRYGELLKTNGTVNPMTAVCGQIKRAGTGGPGAPAVAEQRDAYIRRGGGDEVYLPSFTWHGFRYVQIEGLERVPKTSDVQARALASELPDACEFECSDPRLNQLHRVCRATFLSNVFGVQSDCPARERFGYGGDIAATTEAFIFNFDMHAFYAKTLQDFADEAAGDGFLTETAPFVGIADRGFSSRSGPIGWTVAVPIMLRDLHRYYGDRELLAQHYATCARYVDLVQAKCPELIVPHCIGDHEALEKAPGTLTATAHFHQWARLTAEIAATLDKKADAEKYNRLADSIRAAFQAKFVVAGKVGQGRQGEQLFGLYHHLIPEADRPAALALLKQNIEEKGHALTTGIFGTKYLLEVLSTEGMAEIAGKIVTRREFPGWGFMLDNGATTLWETWKASDNTYSQNHPMFGSVEEWFMKHILGIAPAADAVGFDRITIHPQAVAGLTWARGTYRSVKGPVRVEWNIVAGRMKLALDLPPGIRAKVWLANEQKWTEVAAGRHDW